MSASTSRHTPWPLRGPAAQRFTPLCRLRRARELPRGVLGPLVSFERTSDTPSPRGLAADHLSASVDVGPRIIRAPWSAVTSGRTRQPRSFRASLVKYSPHWTRSVFRHLTRPARSTTGPDVLADPSAGCDGCCSVNRPMAHPRALSRGRPEAGTTATLSESTGVCSPLRSAVMGLATHLAPARGPVVATPKSAPPDIPRHPRHQAAFRWAWVRPTVCDLTEARSALDRSFCEPGAFPHEQAVDRSRLPAPPCEQSGERLWNLAVPPPTAGTRDGATPVTELRLDRADARPFPD